MDHSSSLKLCSIQEEKEKRMESLFESGFSDSGNVPAPGIGDTPEGAAPVIGHKTRDSTKAVDSIIEALDLAEAESERFKELKVRL